MNTLFSIIESVYRALRTRYNKLKKECAGLDAVYDMLIDLYSGSYKKNNVARTTSQPTHFGGGKVVMVRA